MLTISLKLSRYHYPLASFCEALSTEPLHVWRGDQEQQKVILRQEVLHILGKPLHTQRETNARF